MPSIPSDSAQPTTAKARLRILLAGGGIAVIALVVFSYIELRASRDDLLKSMRAEAVTLIDAINRSSEHAILSSDALQESLITRLRTAAELVAHLESHGKTDAASLHDLAVEFGLGYIGIFSPDGIVRASSDRRGSGGRASGTVARMLRDLDDPAAEHPVAGFAAPLAGGTRMYLVAVPRRVAGGGILAGVDARILLAFRKNIGVGTLMREIGNNPDIAFAALQDADGIIAASRSVTSLTPIATDTFLAAAYRSTAARSRLVDTAGHPFLEVVQSLRLPDSALVLTRVGVRLDKIRAIQRRGLLRVVLLTAALLAGIIALLLFVTTRSRFAMLRREHARVRSTTDLVLDTMADAVIAIDAGGIIRVFNATAERIFAIAADDALGTRCAELCPSDPFLLLRTIESGIGIAFEERGHRRPDGLELQIAVSTSIVRDEDGRIDLVVAIARDLTEQKRVREQLERRDRLTAMGALAGGIAHEIRNPLNAISVIAQRFRREFVPEHGAEEFRDLADTVHAEVQRVNAIVTQFLAFARPPRLHPVRRDLADVVRGAVMTIESEARHAGILVSFDAGGPLECDIDAARLAQALMNLFQNAIHAMPSGGRLEIAVSRDDGSALVTIRDTGTGIPPDALPKIFNLYFTTKPGGSGLGLSIVHQVVSEHGGVISVDSTPGSGTVFTIRLPLESAPAAS